MQTGTGKKYWYKCPAGPNHEWEAPLRYQIQVSLTSGFKGCPMCLRPERYTSFPNIANLWHPTRNGDLTPDAVVRGLIFALILYVCFLLFLI